METTHCEDCNATFEREDSEKWKKKCLFCWCLSKGKKPPEDLYDPAKIKRPKDPAEQRQLGAFLLESKSKLHEIFFGALLKKIKEDQGYTKIDQLRCMRLVVSDRQSNT